jgi:hypothetical protein
MNEEQQNQRMHRPQFALQSCGFKAVESDGFTQSGQDSEVSGQFGAESNSASPDYWAPFVLLGNGLQKTLWLTSKRFSRSFPLAWRWL